MKDSSPTSYAEPAHAAGGDSSSETSTESPIVYPTSSKAATTTTQGHHGTTKKKRIPLKHSWWVMARCLLVDIPLALLFAFFLGICFVRQVHNQFYVPLFHRATRTNDDLLEEYTYYERQCTEYDLTTYDLKDLLVEYNTDKEELNTGVVDAAVHQMMLHGGTVIPNILKPETVSALREYIVHKNKVIRKEEVYPMSEQYQRISYGIDASEDPSVSTAIREVTNHPVLRPILAALLGDDDPASAEITSITAAVGAEDQVWHQDTKQDGNAIKFARTFSHSYSLFLPLQNTTELMGITDICPGTHYCANDLEALCENNRLGLHLVSDDNVFPAGHGALLNQHVWHRGGAHSDPTALERVVFVLSFLARPKMGQDPRQLSRGTYFHQKWLMWGHTWKDLMDPATRMRPPFSVLRCLSLWKPSDANWGYDLITSAFMRFSNEMLEDEDLGGRFIPRLAQFHFPKFLWGEYLDGEYQKVAWMVFLQGTIDNTFAFLKYTNLVVHGVYLTGIGIASSVAMLWYRHRPDGFSTGIRLFTRATIRMALTHGLLISVALYGWHQAAHSKWGKSIDSGSALMRPFPDVDRDVSLMENLTLYHGLTTMPTRNDVLIGSRYDADFLGSYNQWLDYHPGNIVLREIAAIYAITFATLKCSHPSLSRSLTKQVVDRVQEKGGRFLGQDFISGDWVILSNSESLEVVTSELLAVHNKVLSTIRTIVNRMLTHHRLGPTRDSAMAKASHLQLWYLRKKLITPPCLPTVAKTEIGTLITSSKHHFFPSKFATIASQETELNMLRSPSSLPLPFSSHPIKFLEGSLVWCYFQDESLSPYFPGTIMEVDDKNELFRVAFEDSSSEDYIHRSRLFPFTPVTEGNHVMGCFEPEGLYNCFPGTVTRVMPGGYISINYDDGDTAAVVPPTNYFVPPFKYGGPYFYM